MQVAPHTPKTCVDLPAHIKAAVPWFVVVRLVQVIAYYSAMVLLSQKKRILKGHCHNKVDLRQSFGKSKFHVMEGWIYYIFQKVSNKRTHVWYEPAGKWRRTTFQQDPWKMPPFRLAVKHLRRMSLAKPIQTSVPWHSSYHIISSWSNHIFVWTVEIHCCPNFKQKAKIESA